MLFALRDGTTVVWGPMTVHDHRIFGPGGLWLDYTSLEQVYLDGVGWEWRMRVREGWRRMYGPKLIENVVQWLASLPIREGMKAIRRELGLRVPLTVHDDVYTLIPLTANAENVFSQAVEIMRRPLAWLPDCPIEVEPALCNALEA